MNVTPVKYYFHKVNDFGQKTFQKHNQLANFRFYLELSQKSTWQPYCFISLQLGSSQSDNSLSELLTCGTV